MKVTCLLGAAIAAVPALLWCSTVNPSALAAPCPDVEVVFARGTFEPPGIGETGQAFVDALHTRLGGRSIDVYAVDYPASLDFQTAADGVVDASNKVRDVAATCPSTDVVLGGYSQGAAVIGYITEVSVPDGFVLPPGITGPMPPSVAGHVSAVVLFGKPSNGFLNSIDAEAPPITVGQLYPDKTDDLCVADDPICSANGNDNGAHVLYAVNGMAGQAADFVAHRLAMNTAAA
jgi:cutinase